MSVNDGVRWQLVVDEPGTGLEPHRAMSDPGVTVWRDGVGTAWGYGYADTSGHWMIVPEVGSFRFGSHARVIRAHPRAGTPAGRLQEIYERGVLPLALQARGLEVLHASAVRLGRGVVAFCGTSRAGKSTTAHALAQRGHRPCADDALALDLSREDPRVIPLPFRVRPRPAAGAASDAEVAPSPAAREHEVDEEIVLESAPLTTLFVLTRTADADIGLTRLAPAAAFSAVLPHAYCFSVEDESRKRRMVAAYCRLIATVAVFEIVFRPGLQWLSPMLDVIEEAVAEAETRAA